MAIEPVFPGFNVQPVWPRPDSERARSDGHAKRDGGDEQPEEESRDEAHPVTNSEGQITGTLVNVTA